MTSQCCGAQVREGHVGWHHTPWGTCCELRQGFCAKCERPCDEPTEGTGVRSKLGRIMKRSVLVRDFVGDVINSDWESLPDAFTAKLALRDPALPDVSTAWEAFDEKARSQESAYESAARAQFAAEATAVVRMLEANIPGFKKTGDDAITLSVVWPYLEAAFLKIFAAYTAVGTFGRQWYNRFRPLVAKTMAKAEPARAPTSPAMLSAIQRRVTKLSGQVTETTAQQIRDVMTVARQEGVGVNELARRIRSDVFGDTITANRATTIARTETVGALNEGAMLKAKQGGVFRAKQWVSQRDGRVRESHREAEAEGWIPIDQPYSNGLSYPHAPGAPAEEVINCRCSQIFTDLTADEANRAS